MSEIKIIPLGTVSPFCTDKNNCPGYLIRYKDYNILLDCGNGITKRLTLPKDLENLHIFISHFHIDHFGDLGTLQYASFCLHNLGMLKDKIKVYLPKNDFGFNKKSITEREESYAEYFDIEDNQVINIVDLKITLKNNNSHSIESFMIKVESPEFKIVYTSDIGISNLDDLVEFSRNSDLLICECSFILKHNSNCPTHFTAHQAGLLAKDSNCKELLLTHFWPLEDQDLYLNEALEVFENSRLPEEGKEYILKK